MEKVLSVAKCLGDCYKQNFSEEISQLQIHKLMYFLQRESLIKNDIPLFDESFHGWRFGPVLKSIRSEYTTSKKSNTAPFSSIHEAVSSDTKSLINQVLDRYGGMSPWKLSALSHAEFSWILSRKGLKTGEDGDTPLLLAAIKCDAIRERLRREEFGCDY